MEPPNVAANTQRHSIELVSAERIFQRVYLDGLHKNMDQALFQTKLCMKLRLLIALHKTQQWARCSYVNSLHLPQLAAHPEAAGAWDAMLESMIA